MTLSPPEPLVGFLVGGVQKGGTTALAHYLGTQPGALLPRGKEAHVFDSAAFDDAASPSQIDAVYLPLFDAAGDALLYGDATPIYLFLPQAIERIARYNPAMRWILLLRDPVERAVSQHHMERLRGNERWPLPLALLLEDWRLRRDVAPHSPKSSTRTHSYRTRGDYANQLDKLFAHFPYEQVLLLRSEALHSDTSAVVSRVCEFLEIPPPSLDEKFEPVFTGDYPRIPRGGMRWRVLRWWFRRELAAMRERYGLRFD